MVRGYTRTINRLIYAGAVLVLAGCSHRPESPTARSIGSSSEARARAEEYLGTGFTSGLSPSHSTPAVELLHGGIDAIAVGHTSTRAAVWKVTYDSVYLNFPGWPTAVLQNQQIKTYHALIDSATGQLVRIYSRVQTPDPELAPEPSAVDVEEEMKRRGEPILGLPSSSPPVKFLEAVRKAVGSNPLAAKKIEASCYLLKIHSDTAIVVWSIIGRGIEPMEIHPRAGMPIYKRNRGRTLVNAVTGEWICVDNLPRVGNHPELDSLLRKRARNSAGSKKPE